MVEVLLALRIGVERCGLGVCECPQERVVEIANKGDAADKGCWCSMMVVVLVI